MCPAEKSGRRPFSVFGVEIATGRSGPVDRRVLPFSPRLTFLVLSSILSLSFVFNFSKLNVVNICAPNLVSDRKTLFERLHNYLIIYVIAGDFNCVDRVMDKFRSRYLSRSRSLSRCANRLPVDFRTS